MSAPQSPIRDLAEDVRKRLTAAPDDWMPVQVKAHRNRAARRIYLAWYGAPQEADVAALVADLLAGEDATVCLDRTRMWSCGSFHDDDEAAWIAHEGQEHLVYQCGCGAIESEGDECADNDPDPDYVPSYCREMGESILTAQTRHELEMAGETFISACQPGEYALCPICRGHGSVLAADQRSFQVCPGCDRDPVFDLSDPVGAQRYQTACTVAVEFLAQRAAERKAQEAADRHRRRRELP